MKNLKKFVIGALASLGLATVMAASAAPASAQAIGCMQVGPGPVWPYGVYTQVCGAATPSNGNYIYQAVLGVNGSPGQTLLKNYMVTKSGTPGLGIVYLFHKPTEFLTWETQNAPGKTYPNIPAAFQLNAGEVANRGGVTITNASNQPQYSIIFEQTSSGTNELSTLGIITGHEIGHWMDNLWAPLAVTYPAGLAHTAFSNSTFYLHELNADWQAINGLTSCGAAPGMFRGYFAIPQNKYYCAGVNGSGSVNTLNSPFAGKTNQAILQLAWPDFFLPTIDPTFPYKEIFAEEYATPQSVETWSDIALYPKNLDAFFGFQNQNSTPWLFKCTQFVQTTINQTGAVPSAATLEAGGCPGS